MGSLLIAINSQLNSVSATHHSTSITLIYTDDPISIIEVTTIHSTHNNLSLCMYNMYIHNNNHYKTHEVYKNTISA